MSDITCRRTKWRRAGGKIEIAPGYYWKTYGPFSSQEKAEEFRDGKLDAEREERREEIGADDMQLEIDNLRHWIKELERRVLILEGKEQI